MEEATGDERTPGKASVLELLFSTLFGSFKLTETEAMSQVL